jgi:hypothetical protein
LKNRFAPNGCACCGYTTSGITCGSCVVPLELKCTWRYRSVTVKDFAHCSPNMGAAVNTLVFPLNYVSGAGWISDWFKITDRQYFCAGSFGFEPTYWVRVQMICIGGSYPVTYGSTPTKDPACLPINIPTCGDVGITGKSTFNHVGVGQILCDPFHAGGATFEGSDTVEVDGKFFERMDITLP